MIRENFRPSNFKAVAHLIIPLILLGGGLYLSLAPTFWIYLTGQVLLGLFFFQCFILLHETGHHSFFNNKTLNTLFSHLFGFLSFIPATSWVAIHNLHHRWTGWRDKDPTTAGTVKPSYGKLTRFIVNFSWWLWIPVFTIGYRYGNYWHLAKIKKYVSVQKTAVIRWNVVILLLLYTALFVFFGRWMLIYLGPGYLISLMISDVFILSQHSHIEIPIAGNEEVKPLRYKDQIPYTRSVRFTKAVAEWLFFNFNLHELHHAYPGLPAYHLAKIDYASPNKVGFFHYLTDAKRMPGMRFIFSTSGKKVGERKLKSG